MRRKVNLVGQNTLTVSLPSRWAKEKGLKKGDEIDLVEDGNDLLISCENSKPKNKEITIDITGLDRTAIMFEVRSPYRLGYQKIILNFKNVMTRYYRDNKEVSVISCIHQEANRLIGLEIIKESKNQCILKDYSANLDNEFDNSVRRLFYLLKETADDFLINLKNKDKKTLYNVIIQKHDTITKHVSYCLRLLNKGINISNPKSNVLYHVIFSIDSIIDNLKYVCREILPNSEKDLSKRSLKIIEDIVYLIKLYIDIHFNFNNDKVLDFIKRRYIIQKSFFKITSKMNVYDSVIIAYLSQIVDICWQNILANMNIDYVYNS